MTWRLIVIEWVDAVWKTTLAKGLVTSLNAIYYKTPGTRTSQQREIYDQEWISTTERFRFYLEACREDLIKIMEIQAGWRDVVCDRLLASTIAHHQSMDSLLDINDAEDLELTTPKTQILLQASRDIIIKRLSERWALTRFEKDVSLFVCTQASFLKRANNLVIQTDLHNIEETLQISLQYLSNNH